MESLSSIDRQTALHILNRIEEAINTVLVRNMVIRTPDDFLLTPEGKEKLDAACMVIEASPIPNPQSPIPNPQSPFEIIKLYK